MPDSPFAAALQAYCLGFEGAWEDYPWAQVCYKVGPKMFVSLSGLPGLRVSVKAEPEEADVLAQLPHIERAAYVGRFGWITVTIADAASFDHAKDLVRASYELVRQKRRRRS